MMSSVREWVKQLRKVMVMRVGKAIKESDGDELCVSLESAG